MLTLSWAALAYFGMAALATSLFGTDTPVWFANAIGVTILLRHPSRSWLLLLAVFWLGDTAAVRLFGEGPAPLVALCDLGEMLAVAAVTFAASASAETVGPVTDELGVMKIEAGDPIEIGGYASSSGPDTSQGIIELRGAELAIRDFGQINGFDVKFVTEDAQCTAEGGQTAATKLAGDAQIVAVVGPSCSSGARVGAPILWNVGIPSIATGATAPNLTAPDRAPGLHGFLRAIANDSVSSALGAEYAVNGLKAKTAATIHDGSPFSEQSARGFEAEFLQERRGARQNRFADVKARVRVFLKHAHGEAGACEHHRRGRAARAAADHDRVKSLRHGCYFRSRCLRFQSVIPDGTGSRGRT